MDWVYYLGDRWIVILVCLIIGWWARGAFNNASH